MPSVASIAGTRTACPRRTPSIHPQREGAHAKQHAQSAQHGITHSTRGTENHVSYTNGMHAKKRRHRHRKEQSPPPPEIQTHSPRDDESKPP